MHRLISFTLIFSLLFSQNYSLKFDGSDDYIQFDDSIVQGTNPFTFMFMAKTSNSGSVDIISQACGSDCGSDLRLTFTTPQCGIEGVSFKSPAHFATFPYNISDNEWHHYTYVFGENGNYSYSNLKVYVDGYLIPVECGHNWGGWTYSAPDTPMTIGKAHPLGGFYSGYLDNIVVFNTAFNPGL